MISWEQVHPRRRVFEGGAVKTIRWKDMCGIAGFVGSKDRVAAHHAVRQMISALARRGPDGEGIEAWPEAVLGHRRLSIFDLSDAGRQPMLSADRSTGVVFNGAIYNFRELRVELEEAGHAFRSQTDTEVLLNGFREWGIDGLVARIRGMYAFAIWDECNHKLFLVRDRLGVKPLAYAIKNGSIAFASTVRALKLSGCIEGPIDGQALAEFLEFGFVTDDRAIYEGVNKLPAASILEWDGGRIRIHEYWRPPAADTHRLTFEDAVQETERLFLRAVQRRLDADVPVGSLLSGGVDSSLVCWAIAKLGGDIRTFTIGTPGDPSDESADAIETARSLGLKHEVIPLAPEDSTTGLDELVAAYAEPFGCPSALGMLRLSRAIKPAATVLLTGDGGDDVFLGYPEHKHFYAAERLANRFPAAAVPVWRTLRELVPRRGMLRRATHFLDFVAGGLGGVTRARDGFPYYQRANLLGERLRRVTIPQRSIPWSTDLGRNLMSEFLDYDRRTRFTGEYLAKVDGGAMHYALEARSPFLDHDLWSFAASLPYEIRLRQGLLKAVLRELARRHIGERVATGTKRGFSIPVQRWVAGRWNQHARELFATAVLANEGWVRSGEVLRELDRAAQHGRAPLQLWYLYVLEMWMRFEQGNTTDRVVADTPARALASP